MTRDSSRVVDRGRRDILGLAREEAGWWESLDQRFVDEGIERERVKTLASVVRQYGPDSPITVRALSSFIEAMRRERRIAGLGT